MDSPMAMPVVSLPPRVNTLHDEVVAPNQILAIQVSTPPDEVVAQMCLQIPKPHTDLASVMPICKDSGTEEEDPF